MPRRGSGSRSERNTRRVARPQPAPFDDFNDEWLREVSENFNARYIDLTREEDRRRWHPTKLQEYTKRPGPRGVYGRPRIVIVPHGHKLARRQTYGGRYSLQEVLSGREREGALWWRGFDDTSWPYGSISGARSGSISRRVGFTLPWQVIICVRRKRRREVMHALEIAGKRGVGAGKSQRRTEFSEVRC